LSGRNDEFECGRRNGRKAERIGRGADKDLRGNRSAGFFLMVGDRARAQRNINAVARQMRVQSLTVMVPGLLGVEMHVHQRRADRTNLYESDEGRRGQPAKHRAIVVKDVGTSHLTSF
jgi:hypothetical protein